MQPTIVGTRQAPKRVWWWFLVPFLSLGFLTFAMLLGVGLVLRHRLTQIFAGVYFALSAAVCVAAAFSEPEGVSVGNTIGALMMALLWLGGTGHVLALQLWVSNRSSGVTVPAPAPILAPVHTVDPAVAAAEWRIRRRQEARAIVADNPSLAVELKIGRPELPNRSYDDGGLIDVNHVPASWLAAQLEISPEAAQQIVDARTRLGGFTQPEELVIYCDELTPQRLSVIQDRLCFLPT